jgi:hypothetical protein
MEVRGASNFESGFQRARTTRVQALTTLPSLVVNSNLKQVVEFAARSRLPAMYFTPEFVYGGDLMSAPPLTSTRSPPGVLARADRLIR